LLRAVAATGMERIKFTTSFPRDFHPDIVAAIEEHGNLCNWVHLPVQSGSDRILRLMRRGHSAADYLRRIDAIKNARRQIAITSDIIVGFPGETEQDFRDTMSLVENVKYDGLYIFTYSERPGTPAAKLSDDVSKIEKRSRFIELEELQKRQQKAVYESYVGREVNVLAESLSAKSESDFTGHTTCHKVVNFPRGGLNLGEIARIKISEVKQNSLYGEMAAA
jgi:tRNA-2-methylthio-N6-dimethylallyladenosine synthase